MFQHSVAVLALTVSKSIAAGTYYAGTLSTLDQLTKLQNFVPADLSVPRLAVKLPYSLVPESDFQLVAFSTNLREPFERSDQLTTCIPRRPPQPDKILPSRTDASSANQVASHVLKPTRDLRIAVSNNACKTKRNNFVFPTLNQSSLMETELAGPKPTVE